MDDQVDDVYVTENVRDGLEKVVCEVSDVEYLKNLESRIFLKHLVVYLTEIVPKDVFSCKPSEVESELVQLKKVGDYLNNNFVSKNKYPFTIIRICELCYQPLKYFKSDEFGKFVRSISTTSFVTSSWDPEIDSVSMNATSGNTLANGDGGSDVLLSKIDWLDQEVLDNDVTPLVKQLDTIMSMSMGYDGDEEMGDDNLHRNNQDVVIEEYYEEDEDDDYVEKIDSDDESDDSEDDNSENEEDDAESYENGMESKKDDENVVETSDDGRNQFKRKPTELDDFAYSDSPKGSKIGTPKKLKPDESVDSPTDLQKNDNNALVSPLLENIESKNSNEDSPLLLKIRK